MARLDRHRRPGNARRPLPADVGKRCLAHQTLEVVNAVPANRMSLLQRHDIGVRICERREVGEDVERNSREAHSRAEGKRFRASRLPFGLELLE